MSLGWLNMIRIAFAWFQAITLYIILLPFSVLLFLFYFIYINLKNLIKIVILIIVIQKTIMNVIIIKYKSNENKYNNKSNE